jgi:hypothetical protein
MKYQCVNGKGDRIEVDLARVQNIGKVFKDSDDFAFTATYESKEEETKVGRFKTSKEAQKQRDALYEAKQGSGGKAK